MEETTIEKNVLTPEIRVEKHNKEYHVILSDSSFVILVELFDKINELACEQNDEDRYHTHRVFAQAIKNPQNSQYFDEILDAMQNVNKLFTALAPCSFGSTFEKLQQTVRAALIKVRS